MRDRKDDHTHRRVAEIKIGRKLKSNEIVHHRDESKDNNAAENLEVVLRGTHTASHNRTRGTSKLRKALRMPKERRKLY